jgi:hypothetical protein
MPVPPGAAVVLHPGAAALDTAEAAFAGVVVVLAGMVVGHADPTQTARAECDQL